MKLDWKLRHFERKMCINHLEMEPTNLLIVEKNHWQFPITASLIQFHIHIASRFPWLWIFISCLISSLLVFPFTLKFLFLLYVIWLKVSKACSSHSKSLTFFFPLCNFTIIIKQAGECFFCEFQSFHAASSTMCISFAVTVKRRRQLCAFAAWRFRVQRF